MDNTLVINMYQHHTAVTLKLWSRTHHWIMTQFMAVCKTDSRLGCAYEGLSKLLLVGARVLNHNYNHTLGIYYIYIRQQLEASTKFKNHPSNGMNTVIQY